MNLNVLAGLAWQGVLKKKEAKLDLLTDMILMVEKGVRGGEYAMLLIDMQKIITNTWKPMIKWRISYLKYWGVNNLSGWTMSLKLPLGSFKRNIST